MKQSLKPLGIPALVFALLILHGATLGLTDDEAYYWVLGQHPALGYAFHPPMVGWVLAFSSSLWTWLLGAGAPFVVRFPAALSVALIIRFFLDWIDESAGVNSQNAEHRRLFATVALFSLAGMFGAAWMMVPDLPLYVGWMLAFRSTWRICFSGHRATSEFFYLGLGCWVAILSKFSGVFVPFSAILCIALWADRGALRSTFVTCVLAGGFALIPILIWNSQHEWGSILYQIRDRHEGAHVNWIRYLRFWVIQLFAAGPPIVFFGIKILARARRTQAQVTRFILVWAAPASLYLLQPLYSDFKPHWAIAFWLPIAMEMAWTFVRSPVSSRANRWIRAQIIYGLSLIVIATVACHWPLVPWLTQEVSGHGLAPKWDVSNDMYGWADLPRAIDADPLLRGLPVVGSRYQTASQAAFVIGDVNRVSLIPRDLKQRDEWPLLGVTEGSGPAWPPLLRPVIFVADIRYDAGPDFKGAICTKRKRVEHFRGPYLAKWIDIYRCDPKAPRGKTNP